MYNWRAGAVVQLTVIPIQRHKIATSVYAGLQSGYRRKMRLTSESAEEEETRLSRRRGRDRARRAAQSSQATKNCSGSETAEARSENVETENQMASRFRKRGGNGDTIIQPDVKQMIISLIQTAYR